MNSRTTLYPQRYFNNIRSIAGQMLFLNLVRENAEFLPAQHFRIETQVVLKSAMVCVYFVHHATRNDNESWQMLC